MRRWGYRQAACGRLEIRQIGIRLDVGETWLRAGDGGEAAQGRPAGARRSTLRSGPRSSKNASTAVLAELACRASAEPWHRGPGSVGIARQAAIKAFLDIEYRKLWTRHQPGHGRDQPGQLLAEPVDPLHPDKAAGGKNQPQIFNQPGQATMKLELILDGTGAVPGASDKSVDEQIFDLRKIMMEI